MTRFKKLLAIKHPPIYALLALLSGVLGAFATTIDNFILRAVMISPVNRVAGPLAYTLAVYWIGLPLTLVYSYIFGGSLDRRFTRPTLASFETQKWAFLTGLMTSFEILVLYIGSSFVDISVVLPLTSLYIIYLAVYDVSRKIVSPGMILLPAILVLLGATGATVTRIDIFEMSMAALVLIAICDQGLTAGIEISYQRGVGTTNTINFHCWRVFWGAIVSTLCIIIWAILTDSSFALIAVLQVGFLPILIWLPVRILLLFIANILRGSAYNSGGPVSEIAVLSSIRVILGVPITLLLSSFVPHVFGSISDDWRIWLIRSFSAFLVFIGITLVYRRRSVERARKASGNANQ